MSDFEVEVHDDLQQLTTFTSDVDLTPAGSYCPPGRQHARSIYVDDVSAGTTLAVVMAGSEGSTRTLTVAADRLLLGKFLTVKSTTDVSRITVGW